MWIRAAVSLSRVGVVLSREEVETQITTGQGIFVSIGTIEVVDDKSTSLTGHIIFATLSTDLNDTV